MKLLLSVCCLTLLSSCLTKRPGSRNYSATAPIVAGSVSALNFGKTVYPITNKHCSGCHGSKIGSAPYQFPSDIDEQHLIVLQKQLININKVEDSPLVQRLKTAHNCWSDCVDDAKEMEEAILKWRPFVDKTLLAPEGYITESVNFLSGEDLGNNTRLLTVDLTSQVGAATSLTFQIRLEDGDEDKRAYVSNLDLQTSYTEGVVLQAISVFISEKDFPGNVFGFVSDVIIAPGTQNGGVSQGATAVTTIDLTDNNPVLYVVVGQIRPY